MTATETAELVDIDAIQAAARRLRGVITRTPLVPFDAPPERLFVKAENLQPIGAFKIRGAYNAIASLDEAERARGVITYSSGNHAQGVAWSARLLGIPAVVVMPGTVRRGDRVTRLAPEAQRGDSIAMAAGTSSATSGGA